MKIEGAKLLIVDDDLRLRSMLERYLREQQFVVKAVASAKEMDKKLLREHFDCLIIDLMMPGEDGLSVCRRLRSADNNTPILMLSAKGEDIDRIIGLEIGADDYLAKPFNPRELVARIKSLLRRHTIEAPDALHADNEKINFGRCLFNLTTRELTVDGKTSLLTSGEFAVLKTLCTRPRQPLSREKLLVLARGRDLEAYDRSIDVQISRLRRMIEDNASKPRYIQTVWGVGYVFVPDDDTDNLSD